MSDQIDGCSDGFMLAAILTTIVWLLVEEIRSRWKKRDWCKIQRGETKRGFRMWLKRQCCPKKWVLEEDTHYFPLQMPFPNDYDWDEWIKRETTSVFVMVDHQTPSSSQYVLNLRRYSFFASDVYTDIAQMVYSAGDGWRYVCGIQLDDRTVAATFKNYLSGRICVVFIEISRRLYRLLSVPPILPFDNGSTRILYVRRGDGERSNRLRIVCDSNQWNFHEFIWVDYEIRPSRHNPSRLFAVEIGRDSMIIPGRRAWFVSAIPGVHMLRANAKKKSRFVYVITINHRGDLRLHQYKKWNRAIMATDIERRSRKAEDDFKALLPKKWRGKCLFYRYYKHIVGRIGDSFVKCQIYSPSMMHVAAEASCQTKPPNADLSLLKSEIGFDIFDGIYEDREKPVPAIYLPSEDELIQDD